MARVPRWLRVTLLVIWAAAALGLGAAFGLLVFKPPVPRPQPPAFATREVSSATSAGAVATASAPATAFVSANGTPTAPVPTSELIGFYVDWDDESYRSLQQHIDDITVLMPMWYHLGNDGHLDAGDPAAQAKALALIRERRPDLPVMPIVNNYDKGTGKWNAPGMAALLRKPAERKRMAREIVDTLSAAGFEGVNIDFEDFEAASRADLVAFMAELYPLARAKGLAVSQDVLVSSAAFDHAALAEHNDYLIPMIYGEHWRTSGPGPIASQAWFEKMYAQMLTQVPADKVVVGLGVYGRNYGTRGENHSLTWAQATAEARAQKLAIRLDPVQLNPTYRYKVGSDVREAWFLDSAAIFDQVAVASKRRPRGYAIWRMGAEDPATWTVLRSRDSLSESVALSLRSASRTVVYDAAAGMIVSSTVTP